MTTTKSINGVTLPQVTNLMKRTEKRIQFYNTKYNFDLSFAPKKEIAAYEAELRNWDFLKRKRDLLK